MQARSRSTTRVGGRLSQFPNESVPIRTISLAGFGNGVPSGLFPFLRFELFDECSEMRGDAYSAYGQARAVRRLSR
jgi:hypothetical protein